MIILITGASHTGKTLLAQRLLERYKYPYLSIDHLKMGLIRSGNTELTPQDDDALTEYLWPIVREIIKTAIENRQGLIVEGCYIPPDWRRDFDEGYLPSIRFICLAMTEGYVEDHFDDIMSHASDIESRKYDSDCTIASLKADNKDYIDRFRNAGGQIVLIGGDYEQALEAAILSLDECFESRSQLPSEKHVSLGYCGVDCFACPDYVNKKCPSCRKSDWKDESCMPAACCRVKAIALCAFCNGFPCQSMAEFYEESDAHRAAYMNMQSIRSL